MGTVFNYSFWSKMKRHISSSVVLIFFTILALICANIQGVKDWYFALWQNPVSLSIGDFNLFSHNGHPLTLGQMINDFLMAIFFLSVGLEIKREIRVGELSTREKAMLPIIGACGGMLVPVLIFVLVCPSDALMQRGVAIPMATDVAFCVPATLKKGTGHYLERIRKNVNKFPVIDIDEQHNTIVLTNEQIHTLKSIESAADKMISPLQDLEDNLHFLINYLVIPLFAFANAGIDLSQMSIGSLVSGVGMAAMLGLVIGKFVGVFSFSWIAVKLKFVSLPAGTTWKAFASVCVVCGIGFTVSMFIADLSYAGTGAIGETLLAQAKLGVLCGSVISAVLGCVLLNKTLPKS